MLEDALKSDVKQRLNETYRKGQFLLRSGLVQEGFSFQKALEDFYDLDWVGNSNGYVIHSPHDVEILPPIDILERKKEDRGKIGKNPSQLVRTLDDFGGNEIFGKSVRDETELSYEKVRESYAPDYKKIERKYMIITHLSFVGLFTSMIGFYNAGFNGNHQGLLIWSVPFFLSLASAWYFGTSSTVTRKKLKAGKKEIKNMPEEMQRRMLAFWKLHELSTEADNLLEEYNQYFK